MNIIKSIFHVIELTAFVLPALPKSLYVRLIILFIYFVMHYFRIQRKYAEFKSALIKKYESESK